MDFVCPFCYETHSINKCGMKCSFSIPGNDYKLCVDDVPKDADGWIDPRYQKKCLKCTSAVKDIYCPNSPDGEDWVVPPKCIVNKNLPIALIGAKATGKSNYIGVLVDEICRKMSRSFECTLNKSCDPRSKLKYEDNYFRPLYKEKMQISVTDRSDNYPMIFPIDFPKSGKHVTLTFYDTAGENLDDQELMRQYNRYIPNSKGILMLLDPLQIPKVRERLVTITGKSEEELRLPESKSGTDILDMVINFMERMVGAKKKFDIPLAVVYTKIDELFPYDDEELIPPDSILRQNSKHIDYGAFSLSDFNKANTELRSIVDSLMDDSDFMQKLERFKTYAFFGVSALGSKPDEYGNIAGGVKPIRVLDPLLWILSENKYIKTMK